MSEKKGEAGVCEALYPRLDDLLRRAQKGELAVSDFFTPKELTLAERYLTRLGASFVAYGGYEDAERKRVYCLPDYMEGVSVPEGLSDYGESAGLALLSVTGSGYCPLSHRDFLGALLGLGLERRVMGDLLLAEDGRPMAYLWILESLCEFVLRDWKTVGRDKVKVERLLSAPEALPRRRTLPIRDTVASPRLDAVVAALCSLSRERAAGAVSGGLVELDHLAEERGDRAVTAPAVISVRGYGKFRVTSLSETTKKGRLRLEAEKYV